MASNLKKISSLPLIDPAIIGGEDILYHVHKAPGQYKSYGVTLSDLFVGTNNLTTNVKFINDSLYIESGRVGINNSLPSVDFDVNGDVLVNGNLIFNKNQDSSSIITGTLRVVGGVGISGAIWGGSLQDTPIGNITRNTAAFTTLTSNANTTFTTNTPSSGTTTGTLVVTGGVGISGNIYAGGIQNTPIGTTTRNSGAFTSLMTNGQTSFTVGTISTSTGTGSLIVIGGVGITGAIWGGSLQDTPIGTTTRNSGAFTSLTSNNGTTFTANSASTSIVSGTLVVTGGVGISGAIYGGSLQDTPIGTVTRNSGAFTSLTSNNGTTFTANAVSSNTTTGTLVVTGGIGISGDLNIGGSINASVGSISRNAGAFTTLTANDLVTFTKGTASSNTTTGTLVVTGGVGISGAIWGGSLQDTPIGTIARDSGAFTSLTSNNSTTFTANIASTSSGTGTLVVTGGVGVTGNVHCDGIYYGQWYAIPSGTTMTFVQSLAPTGWTKSLTHHNKALRVVNGSASTGGAIGFTTAFSSQGVSGGISLSEIIIGNTTANGTIGTSTTTGDTTPTGQITVTTSTTEPQDITGTVFGTVGDTTLLTSQIPAHAHGVTDPGHYHYSEGTRQNRSDGNHDFPMYDQGGWLPTTASGTNITIQNSGSGGSHTHTWNQNSISIAAHSHGINLVGTYTGTAHNHSALSTSLFTGTAHNHTANATATLIGTAINLEVQYVDIILAIKD